MNNPSDTFAAVGFCPHCGNKAPQQLIHQHDYVDASYDSSGKKDERGMPSSYYVAKCGTCNDLLLYHAMYWEQHVSEYGFTAADLVYPTNSYLHYSVPDKVRAAYADAVAVRRTPNAYAVMLRRTLETLCDDRNAPQGTLHVRLKALADKGEIPSVLAEITTILRQLGNDGAHGTGSSISIPMTWTMDRFFRAVIEFVYVAPSELNRFRSSLYRLTSQE